MPLDLSTILEDWPAEPGGIRVRRLIGDDGQELIQLRVDLGVLQMAVDGRPDGTRPYGCDSVLAYLRSHTWDGSEECTLEDEDFEAISRELLQYYRRRISLMAMGEHAKAERAFEDARACYRRAIRDANHNLALLDWLVECCPDGTFTEDHDRYRPLILMHRAVCLAERSLLRDDADGAIEHLKSGADGIRACAETGPVESDTDTDTDLDHDAMVAKLRRLERRVRRRYRRRRTLREQLADAVAREDFEEAARLRDAMQDAPQRLRLDDE